MITREEFLKGFFAFVGTFSLASVGCGDDEGTTGAGGDDAAGTGGNGTTTGDGGGATTGNGGAGGTTATGGTGGTGGGGVSTCEEMIATNHPAGMEHNLEVPPADVEAGTDKSYSIQGNSAHDHMITLTSSDFDMLAAGTAVTKTSTTGAQHTHEVTVTCS